MNRFYPHRKIPIGISSCLLGEQVRYDGGHRHDSLITTQLSEIFEFRSLCPEVAIGLGIPREPIQLVRTAQGIRVKGIHTPELDVTGKLQAYGQQVAAGHTNLCGYIFKARSPSCGTKGVTIWTQQGHEDEASGTGAYAAALLGAMPGLPVTDEKGLQDPVQREHFIEEVTRWHHKYHGRQNP